MNAVRSMSVVYPHLPHYRFGVFRALEMRGIRTTFVAGATAQHGIETIPPSALRNSVMLKNRRIGRVLWQSGLARHLMQSDDDCFIFLGDVSVASYWIGLILLRIRRRPAYLWTIGWHRPDKGIRRVLRLVFYRLSKGLLLYGETGRDLGVQMGYPATRMAVIGNSSESLVAEEVSKRSETAAAILRDIGQSDVPVIGAVIRLSAQKRLNLLIDAAAELTRTGVKVRVVIAGEGPCRKQLHERAVQLGVDLLLPGPIYAAEDLATLYRHMVVTVVPQTAGLTTIQSMSFGVPVVSDDDPYTQAPEWEAIKPGVTGGHYTPGDVMGLADAIRPWLSQTDGERVVTAAACRAEVAAHWSPSVQASKIEKTISEWERPTRP